MGGMVAEGELWVGAGGGEGLGTLGIGGSGALDSSGGKKGCCIGCWRKSGLIGGD